MGLNFKLDIGLLQIRFCVSLPKRYMGNSLNATFKDAVASIKDSVKAAFAPRVTAPAYV